jgi:hypothetical protein
MSPSTPGRVQWILAWLMPSAHAEALLGDLLEERRLRLPGAAPLLAVLVLVATSVMMVFNPDSVPLWYEGSFLVLGSLAPIAGAALSRRWRKA